MSTKKIPGGEEIRKLSPLPWEPGIAARYQQVLDHRVFPPPDSMTVEAIGMNDDEMIILIDVRPQPEESSPSLFMARSLTAMSRAPSSASSDDAARPPFQRAPP